MYVHISSSVTTGAPVSVEHTQSADRQTDSDVLF